jgi:hypothetical protein
MRITRLLLLSAIAALLAGCQHFVVFKNAAGGGQAVGNVPPVLYEDFEKGLKSTYGFGNQAAGGQANVSEEDQDVHGGTKALKVTYKTGNGNWGCGWGFGSNYLPDDGCLNAKGTRGIEFWAKADVGINFNVMVEEGKKNGADDEVWVSSDVTGTGRWKRYSIGWDQFTRSIYSGNQGGDDTLDVQCLGSLQGQLREKQGDGVLLMDDVYFK